jgi:hypothetical protein
VSVDPAAAEDTILRLLAEAGSGKTISPPEVAVALAPDSEWHLLMHAVRRASIRLALDGRIVIYRKGKPVDPNDFKGVYRLGLPRQD